jgi:hypothetical protein
MKVKRRFNNTKRLVYYRGKGEKQFFGSINKRIQEGEKPSAKWASTIGPATRQAQNKPLPAPRCGVVRCEFRSKLKYPQKIVLNNFPLLRQVFDSSQDFAFVYAGFNFRHLVGRRTHRISFPKATKRYAKGYGLQFCFFIFFQ